MSKLERSQLHRSRRSRRSRRSVAQRPAAGALHGALRRQPHVAAQLRHRGCGAVHQGGADEAGVGDEDVDATSCLREKMMNMEYMDDFTPEMVGF